MCAEGVYPHFFSSVMKGQAPKRHIQQCASNLDLGSDQPRGYFGCADFVLFFSMCNINNRCWLSTDTEINRWQRKILDCFFASRGRGVKIIWMTLSAARPSGTQMFRGSSLCDGGDQLAASHTGYSRHLSSPSSGPRPCWWLPTVGSLTTSALICSFSTTQNPAGETI